MAKRKAAELKGPKPKQTRSRAGCLTCRQRKIKCDEVFIKGHCGNCRRVERQCDTGLVVTFRNEQNPSISRPKNKMENFYTYRNTFHAGTTWVPVPATLQFIEVDANKILESEQEATAPMKKNVEPLSIYPQLLPPAQQPQDPTWKPARIGEGLQTSSDAAVTNEESTLYPQDMTLWDIDDDDDPDDQDYAPMPEEQDLLPLAQHQQAHLQQQQDHMDMQDADALQRQQYEDGSLDFFLGDAAAHVDGQIDPDLDRLTTGVVDQMNVKFDGLSEEDMEWLRNQQPVDEVTKT